jgi:hypothetical protein
VAGLLISMECPFTIRRPAELHAMLREVAQEITELATHEHAGVRIAPRSSGNGTVHAQQDAP